jgi:hypothetical protein
MMMPKASIVSCEIGNSFSAWVGFIQVRMLRSRQGLAEIEQTARAVFAAAGRFD